MTAVDLADTRTTRLPNLSQSSEYSKPISRGDGRRILQLAIPVSWESIFQMGFNVIDQVIVGRLGADAVAAVGLSNSIASIALLLYASAGVGAGVLAARAAGRKEMAEVSQIASTGQALAGLLGLLSAGLLVTFSHPLLQAVGADSKLVGNANGYFQLYSISTAPMILSAVTSAVFRSLNSPKTPLMITSAAVVLNTFLGFILVLGLGPVPALGVTGAGWATLFSQTSRCVALILFLYLGNKGVHWVWPWPNSKLAATTGKLLRLTGPIALSEVLWGMSTFVYAVVFTRLGTTTLAASQIVLSLESIFIVASAGLAPAAIAVIGQALGERSLSKAKANAWLVIRFGIIIALILGALYAASSLLLRILYPKVGEDALHLAFWGILLMAFMQPAKVLSSVLGNGILASGGDTRFVLLGNLLGTYAVGLPGAVGLGLLAPFGFFGVFIAKALEECVKSACFFLRFVRARWYEHALKDEQITKGESKRAQDEGNESQGSYVV
ncbi:MAG: MATE family efflux transporter [Verrucomicrobia bacterium]|nr:MATE family efflux transporter [Verrucomicrobiota bacterium]